MTAEEIRIMELELSKNVDTARETGRKVVNVFKTAAEAIAAGVTGVVLKAALNLAGATMKPRTVVLTGVELLGEGVNDKTGKPWRRWGLIGRDIDTMQTLRSWTVNDSGMKFELGALTDFPCVFLAKGTVAYHKTKDGALTYTEAIKDCYVSAEEGSAIAWNTARQAGRELAVATLSAEVAAK